MFTASSSPYFGYDDSWCRSVGDNFFFIKWINFFFVFGLNYAFPHYTDISFVLITILITFHSEIYFIRLECMEISWWVEKQFGGKNLKNQIDWSKFSWLIKSTHKWFYQMKPKFQLAGKTIGTRKNWSIINILFLTNVPCKFYFNVHMNG